MQAIILAGGLGTRLQSVVSHVPKPMAMVGDEPFLAVLLRYMQMQGVREVVFALHHRASTIQEYFGAHFAGIDLSYSVEESPLGTGGAIRKALSFMRQDAPVFVLNGDSLVMLQYREMLRQHLSLGAPVTMASVQMPVTNRYSKLIIENERVVDYALLGDERAGAISAGFYVLEPDVFASYDMPEAFSIERDFFAVHAKQLCPAAFTRVEYFIDIGIPDDYHRAQAEVPFQLKRAA